VLLLQKKIKPHSDRVLTHAPYVGPYIIAEIVQRDSLIGQTYKLVSLATGKSLSGFVNPDRVKLYNENRATFDLINPPLQKVCTYKVEDKMSKPQNSAECD